MTNTMSIDQVPISKLGLAHYMRNYDEFLGPLRHGPLRLLELGIAEGDSLRKWAHWMPNAKVVGLDIRPPIPGLDDDRIATYQGEQQDKALLDRIGREQAPEGFDVIVDDASHVGQLTPPLVLAPLPESPQTGRPVFHRGLGHGLLAAVRGWPQIPPA